MPALDLWRAAARQWIEMRTDRPAHSEPMQILYRPRRCHGFTNFPFFIEFICCSFFYFFLLFIYFLLSLSTTIAVLCEIMKSRFRQVGGALRWQPAGGQAPAAGFDLLGPFGVPGRARSALAFRPPNRVHTELFVIIVVLIYAWQRTRTHSPAPPHSV